MDHKAAPSITIAGKGLFVVSAIFGVSFFLSSYAALSSLVTMTISILLAAFCFISAAAALFRHDIPLLKGRIAAIVVLLFPIFAFFADGNLHITDRIRVHFMQDCAVGGMPIGTGHHVSVCLRRDRKGWGFVEAIIYDSSDQLALPQGEQSREWLLAVSQFHLPFETLPFRAIPLGGHYYLAQFNEN